MALVQVPPGEKPESREVHQILAGLRQGEPVALPTEFGYVFACDAINSFAIRRLRDIRNDHQPSGYTILFRDIAQLETFSPPVSAQTRRILDEYWNELLTLRAPKRDLSWDSGDDCRNEYFYSRSSREPFIQEILATYGPLAISSASAKGWPSFSSPELIEEQFSGRIHTVIGNGYLEPTGKSTVISEFGDEFVVLREGEIKYLDLIAKFPDSKFRLASEMRANA